MRWALHRLWAAALATLAVQAVSAQDITVTFAWNANPEPDIAGYRLYYGTASRTYTQQIDAGNSLVATVSDLTAGVVYFFAATAYNSVGVQSSFSDEVIFGSPSPTPVPSGGPVVNSLGIISNDAGGQDLMPLTNGSVVNLAALATRNINVQALVSSANGISLVVFLLDSFSHAEDSSPYALCGDWNPCPANTLTALGSHTLSVTGYDSAGSPGSTLIIRFNVIDQPSSTPVPTATPAPNPTATPTHISTPTPTPESIPAPTATPSPFPGNPDCLANVSTRLFVQPDNVMVGGFIIYGDSQKRVILRALGPSLTALGVSNAMLDPALRLFDSSGSVIASNNDWHSNQSQIIQDTGFAPVDDREAALVTTLPQGGYTAVVSDANNNSGVALFEFYDLDLTSSQLLNLSTRGKVDTQERVIIGGFVTTGDQPSKIILRAIGPSLTQAGVLDPLLDPTLELHNGDGSLIAQNDNWRSDQEQQILDSGFAPPDDRESAIIATLVPGSYSAVVRGADDSIGTALFEIYKPLP